MSSIVDRVKKRVRSRSRHSRDKSNSSNVDDAPALPNTIVSVPRASADESSEKPRISLENSAFIVQSRGDRSHARRGSRKSLEHKEQDAGAVASIIQRGRQREDHGALRDILNEIIPDRESSLKKKHQEEPKVGHARQTSHPISLADQRYTSIPDRASSSRHGPSSHRRHVSQPAQGSISNTQADPLLAKSQHPQIDQVNQGRVSSHQPKPGPSVVPRNMHDIASQQAPLENNTVWQPETVPVNGMPASIPVRSKSHTPGRKTSVPKQTLTPARTQMQTIPDEQSKLPAHVRLPEGFNLQNTEQTHVEESWRPAVTDETIIKQKTEIFQEAITRDIHVHHYYTYLQPIRVVEILPAKHFILDQQTGVKTEIPAPKGWKLPKNMQPTSPDTSIVKGWTRHYLVNEQYPNGVIEQAPESVNGEIPADEPKPDSVPQLAHSSPP